MNGLINPTISTYLLLALIALNTSTVSAQQTIVSGQNSAGFSISREKAATEPVIHYQQNIQMLEGIDDRPSLQVFGNGRVLVHFPVYMKRAGDYEMQLDDTELVSLIQALSGNGMMDVDETAAKTRIKERKKALKKQGQFYQISDGVESVVDIRLDEYQRNRVSKKTVNFHKRFQWKNIEHDADRYQHDDDITKANNSIVILKALMKDARLIKQEQQ